MHDYFYGTEADQFTFIRIPWVFFTEDKFIKLTSDAKILYSILLRRMELSSKNGWFDPDGRVYIIFTVEEIQALMGCGNKKAISLLNELEKDADLIERKRQGLGRPNLIYVKNFAENNHENTLKNDEHS